MKHTTAVCWKFAGLCLLLLAPLWAEGDSESPAGREPRSLGTLDLFTPADSATAGGAERGPGSAGGNATFVGNYAFDKKKQSVAVTLTATIQEGWHLYSVTQPKGGPKGTSIQLASDKLATDAPILFKSNVPPQVHFDALWPDVPIEEHEGTVIWQATVPVRDGFDPKVDKIEAMIKGQTCQTNGSCVPFKITLPLENVGETTSGYFESPRVRVEGYAAPASAARGKHVSLVLRLVPEEGWHVHARRDRDTDRSAGQAAPTLVVLSQLDGLEFGGIVADQPPRIKPADGVVGEQMYHDGPITWTAKLTVPSGAVEASRTVSGMIAYQLCDANSCVQPQAAKFTVTLPGGETPAHSREPLEFAAAKYSEAKSLAETIRPLKAAEINWNELWPMLGLGLVGGLLLNLMPCVLPVIGLKILAFAEQGGRSRAHVFALNVWYALGLMAVFLVLASLAAFLNLGWGQQFTYTWFKVSMVGLVFAMALSFLGVWEIPIPGFVGVGHANQLHEQEGMSGAFFKGVFTTILATPCSGPFLGPVFAFTLSQPWLVTYLLFASVGLGMALPYLIIGAQPALVRWLPKPGEWMDTFKQLMGFVLLGTVVYLFSTIKTEYFLPTLATMMGVWLGCWYVGRVPAWAEMPEKIRCWAVGSLLSAAVIVFAFFVLAPWPHLYHWEKYSNEALAKAQQEGRTVMVDFTAKWCQTCQYNFFFAINSYAVKSAVEKNGVTTLIADWSDPSEEIEAQLEKLNSRSIPLLAIYPAGKPDQVIVLRDTVTQQQVVQAIEQAGPSQTSSADLSHQTVGRR